MSGARRSRVPGRRGVATAQGLYCLGTGTWPLLSIGSFERATGPKTDRWLVRMVGILAAVIGAALLRDGASRGPSIAGRGPGWAVVPGPERDPEMELQAPAERERPILDVP